MSLSNPRMRRPIPGRPFDRELTDELIAQTPSLEGAVPFDPTLDADLVDEIEAYVDARFEGVSSEDERLGDLDDLSTSFKGTLVGAVNEVNTRVGDLNAREFRMADLAGVSYIMADRPTGVISQAMAGPIIQGVAKSYRFINPEVPLRNVTEPLTVRLVVQQMEEWNDAFPNAGDVIKTVDVLVQPGAASAVFQGTFDVPSGTSVAFMVGVVGATQFVNPHAGIFYGDNVAYQNHDGNPVRRASAPSDSGGIDGTPSGRRIINLYGQAEFKNISGQIDQMDMPKVVSITGLRKGGLALVHDTTGRHAMAYRRVDSQVTYSPRMSPNGETIAIRIGGEHRMVATRGAGSNAVLDDCDFRWAYAGNPTASSSNVQTVQTGGASSPVTLTANNVDFGRGLLHVQRLTLAAAATGRVRIRLYPSTSAANSDWARAYGESYTGTAANEPLYDGVIAAGIVDVFPAIMVSATNGSATAVVCTAEALDGGTTPQLTLKWRLMG